MKARTPEQQQAIEHTHGRLTLVAGAGAGKTGVLTERFVRLVSEHGVPVDAILTITFTRKATAEMKSRIVHELQQRGLYAERRQLEYAYIHTVHALCRRLLLENPFEAGVDPNLRTLDERVARRLKQQAFEKALATLLAPTGGGTSSVSSKMRELITRYFHLGGYRARGDPLSTLRSMAESLLEQWRHAGYTVPELQAWASEPPLSPKERIESLFQKRLSTFPSSLPYSPPASTLSLEQWATQVQEWLRALHLEIDDPELAAFCLSWISLLSQIEPDQEEHAEALRTALLQLSATYAAFYEQMKEQRGALDFADLQLRTLQLLRDSPSVRHRYQNRFRFIMVDEFQDIDPLQAQIIELLAGEKVNVMVVGDLQQAIYGFRFADLRVFKNWIETARRNCGNLLEMHHNFRSHPAILEFVAYVFEPLWGESFRAPQPVRSNDLPVDSSSELPVQVWYFPTRALSKEAELIASTIREWIEGQSLPIRDPDTGELRPAQYRDIALLFSRFTEVNLYEATLQQKGIPSFVVGGGRGYWLRYEVRDLFNLLRALLDEENELAWVSLLRSPMVGLSLDGIVLLMRAVKEEGNKTLLGCIQEPPESLWEEDKNRLQEFRNWFLPLRREIHRQSVGWAIGRALEASHYEAKLLLQPDGTQQVANVRKLWAMALEEPEISLQEFANRLEVLSRLEQREGNAPTFEEESNVVRLFTVHSAKGLEFPVVFLVDTGFRKRPRDTYLECEPGERLLGLRWKGYSSLCYQEIREQIERREREEAQRTLYVALTRARDYLIVCLTQAQNPWAMALCGALRHCIQKPSAIVSLRAGTRLLWRRIP